MSCWQSDNLNPLVRDSFSSLNNYLKINSELGFFFSLWVFVKRREDFVKNKKTTLGCPKQIRLKNNISLEMIPFLPKNINKKLIQLINENLHFVDNKFINDRIMYYLIILNRSKIIINGCNKHLNFKGQYSTYSNSFFGK